MMLDDVWWVILSLPKDSCKREPSQEERGDEAKAFMNDREII